MKLLRRLLRLLIPTLLTGCTYVSDRGRDFTDMFTLSAEIGGLHGAFYMGGAAVGLGAQGGKGFGLRSGALGVYDYSEVTLAIVSGRELNPSPEDRNRGKGYEMTYFPTKIWPDIEFGDPEIEAGGIFNPAGFELTLCLGIGLRVGFNFAECIDFFAGLFGFDPLQDDKAATEQRKIQRKQADETATEILDAAKKRLNNIP